MQQHSHLAGSEAARHACQTAGISAWTPKWFVRQCLKISLCTIAMQLQNTLFLFFCMCTSPIHQLWENSVLLANHLLGELSCRDGCKLLPGPAGNHLVLVVRRALRSTHPVHWAGNTAMLSPGMSYPVQSHDSENCTRSFGER